MANTILAGKINLLPFFTFLITLIISILAYSLIKQYEEKRRKAFFEDRIERAEQAIRRRIKDYSQILLGAKAFVEQSDTVTREEWRDYYNTINVNENYPGIQGIGYSIFIQPDKLTEHIQSIRNSGLPEYNVKPKGDRPIFR